MQHLTCRVSVKRMSKNRLLAGALPQTSLGELTVLTESQTP